MNTQFYLIVLDPVKSLAEVIRRRLENSETSEITKTQLLYTYIILLIVAIGSFA